MATVLENEVVPELERAKPPFLRCVRIRGYKSIAFCDVTLEPLTILVGRNASGKSNFLDALAFLGDLMSMRTTEAVNARKGWRAIHCRSDPGNLIEIGLEATFESLHANWDADYIFSLEVANQNQVRVRHENLVLSQHGRDRRCGYRIVEGCVEWIGLEPLEASSAGTAEEEDKLDDPRLFKCRRSDRLLLSVLGTQPFVSLAEKLRPLASTTSILRRCAIISRSQPAPSWRAMGRI